MFAQRAIVFFVNIRGIDVDDIVLLGWVFDKGERVFEEDLATGIFECAVIEFGEPGFASVHDRFVDFDHMDGGEGGVLEQFAEHSAIAATDDEGGVGSGHAGEGNVGERFVVRVLVEFG